MFDPIATGNPSSSAGVKSWPFGLLPARRMSTEDITGHVRPSPQTLQSAAWRSGEFRSETSMVPALQPHPVRSKKTSPNCPCLNLIILQIFALLLFPKFFKIPQEESGEHSIISLIALSVGSRLISLSRCKRSDACIWCACER